MDIIKPGPLRRFVLRATIAMIFAGLGVVTLGWIALIGWGLARLVKMLF